jgi:hypothetical protein
MFQVFGLTNDRAQLLANQGSADDLETACAIMEIYLARGLLVRICDEDGKVLKQYGKRAA